jgi:hypothetical protein
MIQKIQVLQKRLIAKASEAVDKSSGLAQKDRLYSELKAILARQPGPEIAEQLAVYRASLREKDQQAEQMGLELAMYARRETQRDVKRAPRCAHVALTGECPCAPPLVALRYHGQVTEYRGEIDRIVRELHEVKVKFYEQKRKEQSHREHVRTERTRVTMETAVAQARASLPRFTGGGFSLQRH